MMMLFSRLQVRAKLMLLAGVPVLGTLLLSLLVVLDVRERAQAAAGLGSIENLAQLTDEMLHVLDELQWERAEVTYTAGGAVERSADVARRQTQTDAALAQFRRFLDNHDAGKLPENLSRNLRTANEHLLRLNEVRARAQRDDFVLLDYIEYFAKVNDALIGATAALTQLSSDKELLLSIGGLVSAMQVIERNAREHALLNYVFGKQEFPPGTFRYFVTLLTEQEVYADSVRTWSSEAEFMRLKAALKGPAAKEIAAMRQTALETTDEAIIVDSKQWFELQNESQRALGSMEQGMADTVRAIAAAKVAETQDAVRLAMGLVASVIGLSLLLGWAITRSLTRSVRGLSVVAEAVHQKNDYAIRAEKTSSDELGLLTDTFNGMLAGIQLRDRELEAHRQNLEALVEERTRALSERNEEMRLVLDNIDQGLAMLDEHGKFLGECSKTFKDKFGQPQPGTPFHRALAKDDENTAFALELGYEQLIADVLPLELALEQIPSNIVHDGRHYALSFTRIMHGGRPTGALLVTRDVTEELLAARAKLEQNERVQVFERIMRDRQGFAEFLNEAGGLVQRIEADDFVDHAQRMRDLHTLKGLAAVFDVASVSEAAHALEQTLLGEESADVAPARRQLLQRWQKFLGVVRPVLGRDPRQRLEITTAELRHLVECVQNQAPHDVILRSLIELSHEPIEVRFERLQEQLTRVARRLGKPEPVVRIETNGVRLPAEKFRQFWSSLAHVVRNIVDHGLEPERERAASGKPEKNEVVLRARADDHGVYIEIADDGRGIQWERLGEKAKARRVPSASRADLVRAMFAVGLSSTNEVTQTSGRGVGMSAVDRACRALDGTIAVESEAGRGTRFRFTFPPLRDQDFELVLDQAGNSGHSAPAAFEKNGSSSPRRSRPPATVS